MTGMVPMTRSVSGTRMEGHTKRAEHKGTNNVIFREDLVLAAEELEVNKPVQDTVGYVLVHVAITFISSQEGAGGIKRERSPTLQIRRGEPRIAAKWTPFLFRLSVVPG